MPIRAISLVVGVAAVTGTVGSAIFNSAAQASECTCRAGGRDYEVGRTICLSTPQGFRLATCGMVMNNTSWRFSDTPCVGALREGSGDAEVTALPAPERHLPDG